MSDKTEVVEEKAAPEVEKKPTKVEPSKCSFEPLNARIFLACCSYYMTCSDSFHFLAVEGWTVFIQGLHEEVREEDVKDKFADCGDIAEFHMPLARATGYVKV